jgi:hypothetical protein
MHRWLAAIGSARLRAVVVGAATAVVFGAAVAHASAAFIIGNVMNADVYNTTTTCPSKGGCVIVQEAVGDARTVTRAPFRGVMLKWCVRGSGMFQVFAASYSAKNTLVRQPGTSIHKATMGAEAACFNTRLPIQAGQYLGLILHPNATVAMQNPAPAGTDGDSWVPAPPNGVPTAAGGGGVDVRLRAAYQAYVEQDADGDLYGDDREDKCPIDASTQGACPIAAPPAPTPSPAPAPDRIAPVFMSKPRVSPRAFRARHRARIMFRASEVARLTAVIKRRRDRRYRSVGTIVRRVAVGVNAIQLPRWIDGHTIPRGHYLAVLRMVDAAGNPCKAAHVHFRVR